MALTERYSSANGVVHWCKLGSGQAIVFNHGTPFSSFVWRDIAEAFATKYTVYLWDMPGYGSSDKYEGQDVSLGAQGKLFAELLQFWFGSDDNKNAKSPIVIAHDFGGAVALRAHLLHDAKYQALALVDPVAGPPLGSPFFHLIHDNPHVFAQLPAGIHRALVYEYISSASFQKLHPAALEALAAPWLTENGQPAFYRQIAQHELRFTAELEDKFVKLGEIPAFLCWGTDDAWIPLENGRKLASKIPGVRFREIQGAGHLVHFDKPVQLTFHLNQFLESLV